jgi:nicotinamide phosphoribosyltransferase
MTSYTPSLDNIILLADSYKASHYLQYPPHTTCVYSYIESRTGESDVTLFFGLQYFIKRYLLHPITQQHIDTAEAMITQHGEPFNRAGWEYILAQHKGYLPLRIKALKEGSVVPIRNALITIENTDPKCFWLTSYVETAILQNIWYPTTVATRSYVIRQLLNAYHAKTSDADIHSVSFKLHDFGQRGCSTMESAAIGGLSHLVNFLGTDTLPALLYGQWYYNEPMAGYSIPAAEHSTITSWGRDQEGNAYRNILDHYGKLGKIVAVVSDSYDIFHAVSELWGKALKTMVENSGATVVIRPDSGDPTTIPIAVCERLMQHYGFTVNSKGYRVLPPCIRIIQGDGITQECLMALLQNMTQAKLSLDNFSFGMGGGLVQMVNRDTQGFAMKCSAIEINGEWRDVYKQPITDPRKNSKRGRFAVVQQDHVIHTIALEHLHGQQDLLDIVYENGQLKREQTLADIRALAKSV